MCEANKRNSWESVKIYRRQTKRMAKELGYSDEVVSKLDKAQTISEVERIMTTARKAKC